MTAGQRATGLTSRSRALFAFILRFERDAGRTPTLRDILRRHWGASKPGALQVRLRALNRAGAAITAAAWASGPAND